MRFVTAILLSGLCQPQQQMMTFAQLQHFDLVPVFQFFHGFILKVKLQYVGKF